MVLALLFDTCQHFVVISPIALLAHHLVQRSFATIRYWGVLIQLSDISAISSSATPWLASQGPNLCSLKRERSSSAIICFSCFVVSFTFLFLCTFLVRLYSSLIQAPEHELDCFVLKTRCYGHLLYTFLIMIV